MEYDKIAGQFRKEISLEKFILWVMLVSSVGVVFLGIFFWYFFGLKFNQMKFKITKERNIQEEKEELDIKKIESLEEYFVLRERKFKESKKASMEFNL